MTAMRKQPRRFASASAHAAHSHIESPFASQPLAVVPELAQRFMLEAGVGIEPAYADLQSADMTRKSMP
jgi:hypothetical protein